MLVKNCKFSSILTHGSVRNLTIEDCTISKFSGAEESGGLELKSTIGDDGGYGLAGGYGMNSTGAEKGWMRDILVKNCTIERSNLSIGAFTIQPVKDQSYTTSTCQFQNIVVENCLIARKVLKTNPAALIIGPNVTGSTSDLTFIGSGTSTNFELPEKSPKQYVEVQNPTASLSLTFDKCGFYNPDPPQDDNYVLQKTGSGTLNGPTFVDCTRNSSPVTVAMISGATNPSVQP